jgi:hypothetical protein
MEKLYKIKVTCIADSVAMTSFDTKTPKFFSKVQGHRVLKGDALYLDLIACHADWSDVGTGFRMRLQEALAEFQELHTSYRPVGENRLQAAYFGPHHPHTIGGMDHWIHSI